MQDLSLIGQIHTDLLHWLSESWLQNGPLVCFLEGFPGVGKSSLARAFLNQASASNWLVAKVDLLEDSTDLVEDFLLDLATNLEVQGCDALVKAVDTGNSLESALITLLVRQKVVVVIDEFQWGLKGANHRPIPALENLLKRLGNQANPKGRLLLLSHQLIERQARWSEPYIIKTLSPLQLSEAEHLLDHLLRQADKSQEVPAHRRQEVVTWLGCNPRAIGVLVGSLVEDSLDDLIGNLPELWQLKDQDVSPELVAQLEKKLLERTLSQIAPETHQFLCQLSLYRRDFTKEAIEIAVGGDQATAVKQRNELVYRFLMDHHQRHFSLHPIAREIARFRLRENPEGSKRSHSIAARYYTRHFTAKQIIDNGKLSGYFVEARYHLTRAERERELGQIIRGFEAHLRSTISAVSPVPKGKNQLNERIAVLSALLEEPGSTGLEYHLARLLQARGKAGDLKAALDHAHRSIGSQSSSPNWLLCASLEHQVNGVESAIDLLRQGIDRIPVEKNLYSLYQSCGELLARANRLDEAIDLLRQGIDRIPVEKSLFSLYQSCGELLARANRLDEAIDLLRQGIDRIPVEKNLFSLYQSCGELLARTNRLDEAIDLLRQGIDRIPVEKSLVSLYQSCGELLARANRLDEAIDLLRQGIDRIPVEKSLSSLYQILSKILSREGLNHLAITTLEEGIKKIPPGFNGTRLVEQGLFLCLGSSDLSSLQRILSDIVQKGTYSQQVILAQVCLAQVRRDWQQAANIAHQGIQTFPRYLALGTQEAFSWLCAGDVSAAQQALGLLPLRLEKGNPTVWLKALVELKSGNLEQAELCLSAYMGRSINNPEQELTEEFLIALWLNEHDLGFENTLPFYFPVLPPSLSGLPPSIDRAQVEAPVDADSGKLLPQRNQVFVSYSSPDREWLERLQTMLKPLTRNQTIRVWDDTQMQAGDKWRDEIQKALKAAKVAVLLVSPDFLASDFIDKHELPPLLEAAENEGLKILWVYLSSCLYEATPIGNYQAAHKPLEPLSRLIREDQNEKLKEICQNIKHFTEA